jgi:hypothetical protein
MTHFNFALILSTLSLVACDAAVVDGTTETSTSIEDSEDFQTESEDNDGTMASTTDDGSDDLPDEQEESDDGSEPEESDEETDSEDIEWENFSPVGGSWIVTEGGVVDDGCGLGDHVDRGQPGATLELENDGNPYFFMTFSGGGDSISCEVMDDLSFACDPSNTVDDLPADFGLDALIYADLTTDGYFTDEENMHMETVVDMVCEGPDCGWITILLGTDFPCSMTMGSELNVE